MSSDIDGFELEPSGGDEDSSGFLGMALLALAVGAGSALLFAPAEGARTRKAVRGRLRELQGGAGAAIERMQRELGRREARRRRQERRTSLLIGLAVGAGVAALLVPESGSETRRRLSDTIRRRGVSAEGEVPVDRVVREPQPEPVV
ncbi:MAG TPA: YtxH domain-containing protein [Gemmatimonadales bacterium]|nr:YtxH domain-containing protein [Gemmatimonadales bacterium]